MPRKHGIWSSTTLTQNHARKSRPANFIRKRKGAAIKPFVLVLRTSDMKIKMNANGTNQRVTNRTIGKSVIVGFWLINSKTHNGITRRRLIMAGALKTEMFFITGLFCLLS